MSTDDAGHSALLGSVAARVPAEYREAYLEGVARVRAHRLPATSEDGDVTDLEMDSTAA